MVPPHGDWMDPGFRVGGGDPRQHQKTLRLCLNCLQGRLGIGSVGFSLYPRAAPWAWAASPPQQGPGFSGCFEISSPQSLR